MGFKIFISHSVAPKELGIVYAIANEIAKRGASPFIPDRDWNFQTDFPERIHLPLKEADYVLAIATSSGFQPPWLNKEVKEASKEKKPLLIAADEGIKVPPRIPHGKIVWIDRSNPANTIYKVSEHLAQFEQDKKIRELLVWIGIGGLLFLLFLERRNERELEN